MICSVRTLGISGIQGSAVTAECYISQGLPGFDIVGLPDAAVKEARDRVRAAAKSSGLSFPVRRMSGGNVQKVLVGREIAQNPAVLMTAYAVRGLDINTSYTIYNLLTKEKMQGSAVIYVGEDLDVLLELCDRILVLSSHTAFGPYCVDACTPNEIGKIMLQGENAHE